MMALVLDLIPSHPITNQGQNYITKGPSETRLTSICCENRAVFEEKLNALSIRVIIDAEKPLIELNNTSGKYACEFLHELVTPHTFDAFVACVCLAIKLLG
jgi:hypothetical protein